MDYYFKKHFPYINININIKQVKNDYLIREKILRKELLIDKIFKKYNNNKNLIGECNITSIIFKSNEINKVKEKIIPIDLYQIFDYLREKKLGIDLPFVKYGEESFNIPISLISKDSIINNRVNKNLINDWIGINEITKKINGIMIKKYIKHYNNEPKYLSLILRKNNELTIKLNFSHDDKVDLNDISKSMKNCKKLIDDININLVSKKIDIKQKIEPPDLDINNLDVKLKKNTILKYCNLYIPIIKSLNLNFVELYEFSKKFPEYLYDEFENVNEKNKPKFYNSLKLRYKKISGFIPMTEIIKDIDILKSKRQSDIDIIQIISKKYGKSQDQVSNYILEWKKKYSSYMSSKIDSEYKIGVQIEITNNSIKLNQITNFYQINLIYNFIKNFLLMFLKEKRNNNLNNLINDKKLNIKNDDEDDYILSYEKKNINNLGEVGLNFFEIDLLENKLYSDNDEEEDIINNKKFINNFDTNNDYLAKDDDIAPELRLKCNDAVSEQDRCSDACNDPSYYLRRLQRHDNYLFKYTTDKKEKKQNKDAQYSTRCGAAQGRQPVVLKYDPSDNPKINKDSYTYSLKYSSDPIKFKRWYICPTNWCPACEIPLADHEIDPKTIQSRVLRRNGAQCKTALCPYDNSHQVIIRDTLVIYPGFIDNKHPDGYHCLPCCFKKPQNVESSSKYSNYMKCLGEDVEVSNTKDGLIYILGKMSPIERERYAILPAEVARLLNTRLDTGYLNISKGYLKKGIKHYNNQSFLSCMIDIISCIESDINININKLKKLLIEKLNVDLFRSLHNGNLEIIFKDEKHNLSALDNFKKYLLNDDIIINHKYLWDLMSRENILYKYGVNLIIFDNNDILCPIGEDIYDFYDEDKKTIMILKSDEYYEPIYYLEGDGKGATKKCIFNSELIEIKKVIEIAKDGCKNNFDIDWTKVLKNNIQLYKLKIDNIEYKFEYDLFYTVKELLKAYQDNRLKQDFLPKLQYIDNYNKVYGIVLRNNLYLPVKPSKIILELPYKELNNISKINLQDYKEVINMTNKINKYTNLKYKIEHKILDSIDKKYIIALLNNNNRIIPVKKVLNKDKSLKISNTKYFSDINEFITQKIIMNDKRIEKINKKNYENETFNRLRYELSIFLQKNKDYLEKVNKIINEQNNFKNSSLDKNRKKMFLLLDEIFKKITYVQDKKINFFEYKTPNKRIPCWMRTTKVKNDKSKNYDIVFNCDSDPHCINVKNKCKLHINKTNMIELLKKSKNYEYYLSKILDELLRYKIKREELLNNEIDNIIDKNYVPENENKYIKIQTYNLEEINTKIDNIFFNNFGIYLDRRKLYEETSTNEYSFNKNLYLKEEYKNSNNYNSENLSGFWTKILGNKFKVKNKIVNVFEIFHEALKSNKNFFIKNKSLEIINIKEDLVRYWKDKVKDSRNSHKVEEDIYNKYKEKCARKIKNILNYEDLMNHLMKNDYNGCYIEFIILSKLYNVNLVFLEKRIKKNNDEGYNIIKCNKSNYYILIYESIQNNQSFYNLIGVKNKFLFFLDELNPKFIEKILKID